MAGLAGMRKQCKGVGESAENKIVKKSRNEGFHGRGGLVAVENLCCNIWILSGRGMDLMADRLSSVFDRTSPLRCFL